VLLLYFWLNFDAVSPLLSRPFHCAFWAKKHGNSPCELLCRYPGTPFGEGGVLHRIGTEHGRRAWINPHTDGRVVVAMSSVMGCGSGSAPHKFVGYSMGLVRQYGIGDQSHNVADVAHLSGNCLTNSIPNSWMSVDLGADRTVVPTHYCLRNTGGSDGTGGRGDGDRFAARNWVLEGKAADEGDWQEISRHDNDATLARQNYSVGAWPVDAGGRAFRHLRIRQHGKNANGDGFGGDVLACCGFEVYGRLLDAGA
jgi:hypothetical protein